MATVILLALSALAVLSSAQQTTPYWNYRRTKNPSCTGSIASPCDVSNWANAYPTCGLTNSHQSPVDLSLVITDNTVPNPTYVTKNDGCYTWAQGIDADDFWVDFTKSTTYGSSGCTNNYLVFGGVTYTLTRISFHSPAEHTVGGGYYDAEVQLKHVSASGKYVTVGVFLNADPAGLKNTNNTFLNRIWRNLPAVQKASPYYFTVVNYPTTIGPGYDLSPYVDLFPGSQGHFRYIGSLTEPPCTEGVQYFIFKDPVSISKSDLNLLRNLPKVYSSNMLSEDGDNNRLVQPMSSKISIVYSNGIVNSGGKSSTTYVAAQALYQSKSASALGAFAFIFAIGGLALSAYALHRINGLSGDAGSTTFSALTVENPVHK